MADRHAPSRPGASGLTLIEQAYLRARERNWPEAAAPAAALPAVDHGGVEPGPVPAPPPPVPPPADHGRAVPRSPFLDDFDATALVDHDACHRALGAIDIEIMKIQGQIEAARNNPRTSHDWLRRATVALRAKQAIRNSIEVRRRAIYGREKEARRLEELAMSMPPKTVEQLAFEREALTAKERARRVQQEFQERALVAKAEREQSWDNATRRQLLLIKLLRERHPDVATELWAVVNRDLPRLPAGEPE